MRNKHYDEVVDRLIKVSTKEDIEQVYNKCKEYLEPNTDINEFVKINKSYLESKSYKYMIFDYKSGEIYEVMDNDGKVIQVDSYKEYLKEKKRNG